MYSRSKVINLISSWLGYNESDGSYKVIINLWNTLVDPPRGVKMRYTDSWCACTWSAIAIALKYIAIMPIEVSCGELIKKAKEMGCWQEKDDYIPLPADAILYDWDDDGKGDNTGWPDHIGIVEYVNTEAGYMIVIEGNYQNSVKKRTISINGKYIRGYITPKYDEDVVITPALGVSKNIDVVAKEVIAGVWGNGEGRKKALEKNGLNYEEVQLKVTEILNGSANNPKPTSSPIDKVEATCYARGEDKALAGTYETMADLYCRNDAGTNKKALCLIPKGTKVQNYGYYTEFNGVKWLLIQFMINGVTYTGFSSSSYLKK